VIEKSAKLNTVMTHVFECRDLERAVKDVYGIDIDILNGDFIPDERIGHYTYNEWTVDGETELDLIGDDLIVAKWIETGQMTNLEIDHEFWQNPVSVGLEHILHRLFIEGHIPAGNYLMTVDW
jgi:hypothetical protein